MKYNICKKCFLVKLPSYLVFHHLFHPPPTDADDLSDSFLSGEEENGIITKNVKNEINGNWISAPNSIHEARLKAKAKRRLRKTSSRDSGRGDSFSDNGDPSRGTNGTVPPTSPKSKLLDRKSRAGKGRGLPKKGMGSYVDVKNI